MRVVRRGVFGLSVLVSVVVLFSPGSDVPGAPPGVDKVVHFAVFAILAVTGRWAGARLTPLAVALAGYAVASEIIQAYAPIARDGSLPDVLADAVGILAGLAAFAGLRHLAGPDLPAAPQGRTGPARRRPGR